MCLLVDLEVCILFLLIRKKFITKMMDTCQASDERASEAFSPMEPVMFSLVIAGCCINVLLVRYSTYVKLEVWHLSSSLNVGDIV